MQYPFLIATALVSTLATQVLAHDGPRIWLNIEAGKVVTYDGVYPPPVPTPTSIPSGYKPFPVFTTLLDFDPDYGSFATDFPGFQTVPGGVMPAGSSFTYDITRPLLYFVRDAATGFGSLLPVSSVFPAGGDVPTPQLAVSTELGDYQITADGFVGGDLFASFGGSPGDHHHLTFVFLGDGVEPVDGPDGIYVLGLQFRTPGVATSDEVLLFLGKNVSQGELDAATRAAWHATVPEPRFILATFPALLLLSRSRR